VSYDAPSTGVADNDTDDSLNKVDLKINFRLWLVWVYNDGTILPLAATNWSVQFYGTTFTVEKTHGVTSDGEDIYSLYPECGKPNVDTSKIYNYKTGWTGVG
jgi:hypothetical protein